MRWQVVLVVVLVALVALGVVVAMWYMRPTVQHEVQVWKENVAPVLASTPLSRDQAVRMATDRLQGRLDTMAALAHEAPAPIDRLRAMAWLAEIYRYGWGPFQRNVALSQLWREAAGMHRDDVDNEHDDRRLALPVVRPRLEATRQARQARQAQAPAPVYDARVLPHVAAVFAQVRREAEDTQNVHDPGVTQSVHDVLSQWRLGTSDWSYRQVLKALPDSNKKETALLVLDRMDTSTEPLVRSQLTEAEILALAWAQRKRLGVSDHDAAELLQDRLNDAVEDGGVVCTTGRVTRVIDMWSGIDVQLQTQAVRDATKQEHLHDTRRRIEETIAAWPVADQQAWTDAHAAMDVPHLRTQLLAVADASIVDSL